MSSQPVAEGTVEVKDESKLTRDDLFAQNSVKIIGEYDFTLDNEDTPIGLKSKECILILFYMYNIESQNLARIWTLAASQSVGPLFGACDLSRETRVAEAFNNVRQHNLPFKWAELRGVPFILVYRNGWPAAFYNGERGVQAIIDYAMTLACDPGYYERQNLPASSKANENYEMTGWKEYQPQRTSSLQFKIGDPVRVYDDKTLVEVGSTAAAKEAQEVSAEEAPPTEQAEPFRST